MKLSCQEGLVPGETFAEKLRNLERYGFDGIEINGSTLNDAAGLRERKLALADSPVRASSICGGHPPELVHPDPKRRQTASDALKRHLELAGELGAAGPITVPIFNGNDRVPDLSPYKSRFDLEMGLLTEMLRRLTPFAEQANAAVLLEPLNRYESNSLPKQADGAAVVRALASPGVRLMSDVFHMHIEEVDLPKTLSECSDVIGHIHLADNTRLEPGSGCTDFRGIMRALVQCGYTGFMALECGLSGPPEVALPNCAAYLRGCME